MKLYDNPDVQKNNRGFQLLKSGSKAEGMRLLHEAAQNGQPNAIATILWHNLLANEIEAAIANFEKCIPASGDWIQRESQRIEKLWLVSVQEKRAVIEDYRYQVSNSKSNAGLAYLANGQESTAMALWNEAAMDHGHVEARFYPLFQMCIQNPSNSIGLLMSSFTKPELQRLIKDTQEISSGNGWLAEWAKKGMNTLKAASQSRRGGAAGAAAAATGAGVMASKQFRDFVQDQIDEQINDNEGLSDWFSDLF